jgi:methylmalonyl-CoA mutase cobalamin-binding domain/chain
MTVLNELAQALVKLDENKIHQILDERISAGEEAMNLIHDSNQGLAEIGRLFETGEYFLSELIFSGNLMNGVMKKLEPILGGSQQSTEIKGSIVIGTVKDDMHDIGKNIMVMMLKGCGFHVIDLGVDVSPEKFVDAVRQSGSKVVGLSALLSTTYPNMKGVIDALKEAGLRDGVTVIIGGAPVDENVCVAVGADEWANDGGKGIRICKEIFESYL